MKILSYLDNKEKKKYSLFRSSEIPRFCEVERTKRGFLCCSPLSPKGKKE